MKTRYEIIARRPAEVLSAAKQLAASRSWKVQKETGTELEIKTRISVMSWGETVKVTAVDNPSAPGSSQVTVTSSARAQVYDWGKSGSNVDIIMTGLTQGPGYVPSQQPVFSAPPQAGKKFCANCGKAMPVKAVFCPSCGERTD